MKKHISVVMLCFISVGACFAADFPKVSATTQKERDQARVEILEFELKDEQVKLDREKQSRVDAIKANKPKVAVQGIDENIARINANIAALAREVDNASKVSNSAPTVVPKSTAQKTPDSQTAHSLSPNTPVPYWDVYRRKNSAQ